MTYDSSKLLTELLNAGLPVDGVDSNGKIDFKPEATDADREQAAQILAANGAVAPDQQAQPQLDIMNSFRELGGRSIETWNKADVITVLRMVLSRLGMGGLGASNNPGS